jgi:hypothetical protein
MRRLVFRDAPGVAEIDNIVSTSWRGKRRGPDGYSMAARISSAAAIALSTSRDRALA